MNDAVPLIRANQHLLDQLRADALWQNCYGLGGEGSQDDPRWEAVRKIERLQAEVEGLRRSATDAIDDLRLLMRALKMPDHARPQSPHEVWLEVHDRIHIWRQALEHIAAADDWAGERAGRALHGRT